MFLLHMAGHHLRQDVPHLPAADADPQQFGFSGRLAPLDEASARKNLRPFTVQVSPGKDLDGGKF